LKVLIAVFAFSFTFYADHCKADQTFPLNDGGYATVIDKTVDLVATGYLKESPVAIRKCLLLTTAIQEVVPWIFTDQLIQKGYSSKRLSTL
jgi:hypothetical protein